MAEHWGIELRISWQGAVMIQGNSDDLYLIAKYTARPDGWAEVRTVEGLVVEHRAVLLYGPEEAPDGQL